jgi:3-phenylpropionate/trans-cinnamate dioxygenase ferredoxin subunit
VKRYVVGAAAEIPPGTRRLVRIEGRSVGVFNVNGEYFAIRNRCPHQGGPLCLGQSTGVATARFVDGEHPEIEWNREGEVIRCPWHGWEFDLRTGRAVFGQGWRVAVYRTFVDAEGAAVEVATLEQPPPGVTLPPSAETYRAAVEDGNVIVEVPAA